MRYLLALAAFYLVLVSPCRADVEDGFNGVNFRPVLEYRTVDAAYTGWNKFWLTTAVIGQAADIASTIYAINHGAEEANPLFGKDPDILQMAGVKAVFIGTMWLVTEYVVQEKYRQRVRDYVFAPLAFIGCGAAAWNMGQVQ